MFAVMCVSCSQLTQNVNLSTALALQRFVGSCISGFQRANNRSDDEAKKNATDDDIYQGTASPKLYCPRCRPPFNGAGQCCGNGECDNYTAPCVCDEG